MRRRKRMLDDLDQDIRDHIARETQDNIERGMSPEEARYAALRKFGNVTQVKEETRKVWSFVWLDQLLQDMRYGLRMLRKNPGFTAIAILTLALGIGANTAIFSAVNGILLQPLPYTDSSRLVTIRREQAAFGIRLTEVREIQEQCSAFERIAEYQLSHSLILTGEVPMDRWVVYVSADFFPLLGVRPLLGRPILPEDTQPGHAPVVVLSYRLWMDGFGGDPGIVGRGIFADNKPYTVIGVMPREFELGVDWSGETDQGLWAPLMPSPSNPRASSRVDIVARLKKGETLAGAKTQLQTLSTRFAAAYPKDLRGPGGVQLLAQSVKPKTDPRLQTALLLLLGAVGFVLLMACVNVSALLVARSWTRHKELAIRKALGATRMRIVRQLLSESVLLALAGGAMGLVFSIWGIRVLRVLAPPNTPRLDRIKIDGNVLWFTLGISLLAAILFGLAPALQITSRRMGSALKESMGGSFIGLTSRHRHWLRSALVVVEVALAVVLVVGGALMARSFGKLMQIDTGVRSDHVLTMRVKLSDLVCDYKNKEWETKCSLATENVLDGIRSIPGVERVGLSSSGPMQGGATIGTFHYPGEPPGIGLYFEGLQGNQISAGGIEGRAVTPGFFSILGIRLMSGRDFGPGDVTKSPSVAIVSQGFAAKYLPGDPLGKRFSISEDKDGHHSWIEIVGLVNDVRDRSVDEFPSSLAYYTPTGFGGGQWEVMASTSGNPMPMVPAMEHAVLSVDKHAVITKIKTIDQIVADSAAAPKFQTALLGSFGVLGLLLAVIGIYGVISYSVVQRTHEIGVRMALGAQPRHVMRLVVGQGTRLALIGIVFGLWGALALSRFLRSMLFEVKPTDPVVFAGVAILFLVVALAACYVPARRAMRVDPLVALRHE